MVDKHFLIKSNIGRFNNNYYDNQIVNNLVQGVFFELINSTQ